MDQVQLNFPLIASSLTSTTREGRMEAERLESVFLKAAEAGDGALVQSLLQSGVDVDAKNDDWPDQNALHFAAKYGHAEVARLLLSAGADVTATDGDNLTALHYAAKVGSIEIAQLLLAAGADVDALDYDSQSPANTAELRGHTDLEGLLRAASLAKKKRAKLSSNIGQAARPPQT